MVFFLFIHYTINLYTQLSCTSNISNLVQVAKARDVGVNSIVLFPKVPDALKVCVFLLFSVFFIEKTLDFLMPG